MLLCYAVPERGTSDSQDLSWATATCEDIFSCFIKPEPLVECRTAIQLSKLDLEENAYSKNVIFMEMFWKSVKKKWKDDTFLFTIVNAYIKYGKYIQEKLPLQNENSLAIS